jgi:hypothetical protein
MSRNDELKVITPKFRASFAKVFKPEAFEEGQDPVYSITMLFPKDTDIHKLKAAARAARENKWGNKPPKKLENPFKDGNDYDYDGYKDMIAIRASTKYKPEVVDKNPGIHLDEEDFYSGCWARASVQAFAYDYKGMKKGVSFALRHVQKLTDDEAFSGKSSAVDDFDDGVSERGESHDDFGGDDDLGF